MQATMDGMLCDRCGEPATSFHEDYGNVCPACFGPLSERFAEGPSDLAGCYREISDAEYYALHAACEEGE